MAEHARTHLLNIVRKYLRKNQPQRPSQSLATGVLPKGWNVSRSNQEMWRESRDVKGCEGMQTMTFAVFCHLLRLCDNNNIKQNLQHLHHEISHRLPSHPCLAPDRQEISMGQIPITNQTTKFVWGSAYKLLLNISYSLIHMPLIIISYHHFRWGPCEVGTITAQMAAHRLPMSTLRLLAGKNSVRLRGCAGRPAELAMLTKRCHCHPIRIWQCVKTLYPWWTSK